MRAFGNLSIFACAVAVCALSSNSAMAGTQIVTDTPENYLACYEKHYVPRTVLLNDEGQLVTKPGVGWVINGNSWLKTRSPGIYIQTSKTLDPDHYTLVPVACPAWTPD